MLRPRIIPVLLYNSGGLYKTTAFKNPVYIGDPINAVKIFNEKEVDEIIFLDITATKENRKPNYSYIAEIAGECFMPLCYGGGVKTLDDIKIIVKSGVEKICINAESAENLDLIKEATLRFGGSTIVVSMDVKMDMFGRYFVYIINGSKKTKWHPVEYAKKLDEAGVGEIMLNSIERDGTQSGYDINLIKSVTSEVNVPIIACGGAGSVRHFQQAFDAGASAAAAGSMFVFQGKHRAVLINFPTAIDIATLSFSNT
jgi:imidazole glycerol-phosphate synthase subunit HisF